MEQKTDRRVIKTKHAIYKAFVELLNEKDVNQITITDIAKKANINRKTFYNYYSDAYEVMEEIENLTVEAFINNMGTVEFTNMADFLTEIFIKFTETVNKDLEFFNLLFKTNNRSFLIVKIVEALKEYVQKRIEESNELDMRRFEVVSNFYLSGVLSVYMNWFMNNYDQSIEEISALLAELVLHGNRVDEKKCQF
ncbi:TetR/AcrR family transcriptional regulator [uncultured Catenibacterium sp.]|uniref:TetR/AcrR family transcriptional regulator n=1 Tax=uncultured Catenibacterium sp. TaxID=286142 RepID=UPI0025DBD18A|nr:TetR/AcrR family transcriptional regulator [uncultured Catenibacterium sp.]